MQERTWQEYDTPGTTVLTTADVEVAEARLERMWQNALRRAREVRTEREQHDTRRSEDTYLPNVTATVCA